MKIDMNDIVDEGGKAIIASLKESNLKLLSFSIF